VTSDLERKAVLEQNEWLRERYNTRTEHAELFQKLRRCCICLQASCADQVACRAEFEEWTKKRWDAAVDERLDEKLGPEMVRVTETGEQIPLGRIRKT
jgi:hypothetical protein